MKIKDLIDESGKARKKKKKIQLNTKEYKTLIDLNCALFEKARKLRSINALIIGQ